MLPTASVLPSGLKSSAWRDPGIPAKKAMSLFPRSAVPLGRSVRVSKKATLPSSPRTASVRPSGLSASSRMRSLPWCRMPIAFGIRSSAARRLLRVASELSRFMPSRPRSSDRSRLGSISACAPRRCATAAVASRRAWPRFSNANAAARAASASSATATTSKSAKSPICPLLRLASRTDAAWLSSRKCRSN